MARIEIKVHPRAKRTTFAGRLGEAYKLHLAAPPVDGKANDECIRFLAELAGVPRSRVRIVRGETSRNKVIDVEGIDQSAFESAINGINARRTPDVS